MHNFLFDFRGCQYLHALFASILHWRGKIIYAIRLKSFFLSIAFVRFFLGLNFSLCNLVDLK